MPNEIAPISTVRRSLEPVTFSEAFEFAQQLAKSSMVPAEYRGKPENILLAIQWGKELGLAPLQAIQNLAVINGKPSVYGDALIALVRGSPVCDDVIEAFEGDGDDFAAICEARRKGKAPVRSRFSVGDAKAAGLWGKQGPWKQYPRRMLQMRARGFALRDAFPDVLRGVITREEAEDYPVDVSKGREPIDVAPRADLDRFAALASAEASEPIEDGGPNDADALRLAAEQTAMEGTEPFRAWWKTLARQQRDELKPGIAEYQRVAMDADGHAAAERDDDPFGLPPLDQARTEQPQQSAPPDDGRPWLQRVNELAPQSIDLASDEPDWPRFANELVALIARATAADLDAMQLTKLPHVQRLRTQDGDQYRRITTAISERARELAAA
jgi:hypothetical protein